MYSREWIGRIDVKIKSILPLRQVYVWLTDPNGYVVIVSKDGDNWQLPGGKPNTGETMIDTAVRETREETGLDISRQAVAISGLGYYEVSEIDDTSGDLKDKFIQARVRLLLENIPDSLQPLEPEDSEAVKFAKKVHVAELGNYIPWMPDSPEYNALFR